jgi:RNA polymerase sigma factor (TIGR02999 family)
MNPESADDVTGADFLINNYAVASRNVARYKVGCTLGEQPTMSDVTRILSAIKDGDPHAGEQLLPLVYDELRKLAAAKLAQEKPGQTLQATALVHEAYLRLIGPADANRWRDRGHFFAAAAEAMRRILVDQARRKAAEKRGGDGRRFELAESDRVVIHDPDTLLTVDEVLTHLANEDPGAAAVGRLRLFAGLSIEEAAAALNISRASAFRDWAYVRAVLSAALTDEEKSKKT